MRKHDVQRQIYRDFKDFIQTEFSGDRKYPDITVCKFEAMPEPNLTNVEIPFENVNDLNDIGGFEKRVESFRKGTKLGSRKSPVTGQVSYTARIPFDDNTRSHKSSKNEEESSGSPNPLRLVGWNMALLGLVAVAWRTTSWSEWQMLGKIFGL